MRPSTQIPQHSVVPHGKRIHCFDHQVESTPVVAYIYRIHVRASSDSRSVATPDFSPTPHTPPEFGHGYHCWFRKWVPHTYQPGVHCVSPEQSKELAPIPIHSTRLFHRTQTHSQNPVQIHSLPLVPPPISHPWPDSPDSTDKGDHTGVWQQSETNTRGSRSGNALGRTPSRIPNTGLTGRSDGPSEVQG